MKLIFTLALFLWCSIYCFATTIIVSPNATINTPAKGVLACQDGDTLIISTGNYEVPNIKILHSIVMIGAEDAKLISKSGDAILSVEADGVWIENLIFEGVATNYLEEHSAIRIIKSKDFTINKNTFIDCFFAIYLQKARKGRISENIIRGNANEEADSGNGIHAWYCDSLSIVDNDISYQRDGIYFEFVDHSNIERNNSHDNIRYGLHFMFSNDDNYLYNTFQSNGVGVAVMFSKRIDMRHNIFIKNWGSTTYGLLLKEIYDAQIENNDFIDNTIGINIEGTNRLIYRHNNFIRNGWAIRIRGGCEANKIVENNFENNTLNMMVGAKMHDNIIEGNYWSDYSGYDLDRDGIGDVPFFPVNLFSYILSEVPESVVLLRSMFVEIINYSEKVSPVFTPKEIFDAKPKMQRIQ